MLNHAKFLISAMLASASLSAFAQDLNVIRIGAPGANSDLFTSVMASHLDSSGWKTNVIGFADCKGAEDWVLKNPTAPVMFTIWSDDFVLPQVSPEHPRNCPALTVNQDSLVTIINEGNHMICSIKDRSVNDFLTHKNAKVGIWNHPVQMSVARDVLADLKVPDAKLVGFARGADMMQALVASDIDYMILSSENLARRIDANCFITTAPVEKASTQPTIKNPQVTLVSIQELVNNPTRVNTGLWPLYISYNVDVHQLRQDVSEILKTAPEYKDRWTATQPLGGVASGDTPEKQWEKLNRFITSFSVTQ